ncbi:hypothetical protein GW943_02135 [Candidatus Parcubacteria bacterium]|uniref:Type 4 fimbrial biogenesis protein PilX N-terminal domain-containing protein n=1 Tax=Candidatus Kaiserbacteria bacterium CG10_big_fil_rev_8_21_14_0_10_47_16 TaxID=1974608 RepID=A0A2H0UDU6_9BACT|nr:hypothetical protein [Candidatus Parcubacteria bacterium]PIR84561.1 MAG: hypothetical protein COU16_03220 [Candidatus Kaiserbacteria bacterium CG10_big_fil_rev_8_21_14_0_10_47_16]
MQKNSHNSGYLLVLILVFGAIFFAIISSFIGFVVTQHRVQEATYQKERALEIAEAGLNYYRWYLAHNPDDVTNGTGVAGPYVHTYADPEGADIGEFSLAVASSTYCGDVYAIDITSTGSTYDNPNLTRSVYARYARPTVAEYAYIINSNVWAGDDRVIVGPYHSNGIIRMDGTNNSTVTSGQESWSCDSSEMPCSPYSNWSTTPAVYGDGPNSDLWTYPSTPINFTGLTVDLAEMQDKAQNAGGVYIGPSGKSGYHITFKGNGTFDLYTIKSKQSEPNGYAWGRYLNIVKSAQFTGNYAIPTDCPLIYVEDQVWLDGVVGRRVTLAAADVDSTGVDPSIILNGNITYNSDDAGLLAIAEYDVLVGLVVPTDMELNGIFVAQNGHFGRNYYDTSMPNAWETYIYRNSLTINGTIVSNGRVGTKWTCGGTYCSGFNTRYNSYDRDLVSKPPPLTPDTSDTYQFVEWRENN